MTRAALLVLLAVVTFMSSCTRSDSLVGRFARATGPSNGMVISQVYGGGSNSGAVLNHDYVELFNRGTTNVDLTGWSVQYGSPTGTSTSTQVHALPAVTVQPGHYYLIEFAGGTTGVNLPLTADDTATNNLGATSGKVALLNNATACPYPCAPTAA